MILINCEFWHGMCAVFWNWEETMPCNMNVSPTLINIVLIYIKLEKIILLRFLSDLYAQVYWLIDFLASFLKCQTLISLIYYEECKIGCSPVPDRKANSPPFLYPTNFCTFIFRSKNVWPSTQVRNDSLTRADKS